MRTRLRYGGNCSIIGPGIKITMINMLRALMEKVDDLRELAQS